MSTFSLRKLEVSLPIAKEMEAGEPTAFVKLAAIALIDEKSLKLYCSGNKEVLQPFVDEAYDMAPDSLATLLSDFTRASKRFSMILSGLSPENVNQLEKTQREKMASLLLGD